MINKFKKKQIIYIVPQLYCFGEPINQIYYLRNLYHDQDKYQITVITYPLQKQRINKAVYNIIMRGLNVIHSSDHDLIWFATKKNSRRISMVKDSDNIYIIYSNCELFKRHYWEYQNKVPKFRYSLTKKEYKMGHKLRDDFGIPEKAPIVTLSVRESGWFGVYDQAKAQNANIDDYIPAINYLIDKGFYIVRIGDKNMKQFENPPSQFIDAPFHPAYIDLVDPYFIAVSKFFVGTPTGPFVLAEGFGIPKLGTNLLLRHDFWADKKDLLIYKSLYSYQLKRHLSYEEVLLSPLKIDFENLQQFDIELISNTPDEILAAVKEMILRLDGIYSFPKNIASIRKHFQKVQKMAVYFNQQSADNSSYIPLHHLFDDTNFPISMEYLKSNPDYLGHDWLN